MRLLIKRLSLRRKIRYCVKGILSTYWLAGYYDYKLGQKDELLTESQEEEIVKRRTEMLSDNMEFQKSLDNLSGDLRKIGRDSKYVDRMRRKVIGKRING